MIDLQGRRFGRLSVLSFSAIDSGSHQAAWLCRCQCGKQVVALSQNLRRLHTQSCGCRNNDVLRERSTVHGRRAGSNRFDRSNLTYKSWESMNWRCSNSNAGCYPNYGGRGITVCDRWRNSFVAFLEDMGERMAGLTLDRIDNDGNYEPGNCRWADRKTQRANRRATAD